MTLDVIKRKEKREVTSAIIVIALVSVFILSNFFVGFLFPLFLIIFAFVVLIAFVFPRSGVYATVFLTFMFERFFALQPIIFGKQEYKIYLLDIILLAIFTGTFFYILNHPEIRKRLRLLKSRWFGIFIVLSAVHFVIDILIFHANETVAFSSFKYYVFYPLIYFVILILFNHKREMKMLFKFIIASGIGVLFFLFYGVAAGGGLWTEFTPLSTGGIRIIAFTHAFYVTISFLILLVYLIFTKNKNLFYYFLIFLWMIGIAGSLMRHLWIGIVVAVFTLYLLLDQKSKTFFRQIIVKYILVGMVVFLSVLYFAFVFASLPVSRSINDVNMAIYDRATSFLQFSNDESFSWRNVAWKEATKEYIENPLYGVGLGQDIYVERADYRDIVEVRNIHNSWLVLLFQMGIVVFAFLTFFIYEKSKILVNRYEKDWVDVSLIVLLVNYIVVALFQPYFETNMLAIFFWMILGLISAKIVINQNASKSDENFGN